MKIAVLENLAFNIDHFVSGGLIRYDPRDNMQTMKDTAEGKVPDITEWPIVLQIFLMECPGGSDSISVTLDKSQPLRRSALQRYTVTGTDTDGTIELYLSMLEQLGCNPKYLPSTGNVWEYLGGKPPPQPPKVIDLMEKQATKETGREDFLSKAQGGDNGGDKGPDQPEDG